jgi:acyl transferase domain-containing protein/acyl carrier protein
MNGFSRDEITLNWMSLDHVAGLIYFHLRDVFLGCLQIHAPIEMVLQQPLRWLDWIEHFRVTVTFAPNFAYGLVNEHAQELGQRKRDLSSIRYILNGAEAIVPKTARNFLQELQPHGLAAHALCPVWGMSEISSGVSYSHTFSLKTSADSDTFVKVGAPIPGVSLRIVNLSDQIVEEGVIGRVQVQGLTVMPGYYNNPTLNKEAFTADGWFITGDLGMIKDGELIITGREKDIIIINGINYYSHEIESVVETIADVETSYTAACGVRTPDKDTEALAIFFHASDATQRALPDLLHEIRRVVIQHIGITPDFILPVEKDVIPKTSIGKIQRAQLKQRFEAGEFDVALKRLVTTAENDQTLPDWFYTITWQCKKLKSFYPQLQPCTFLVFLDRLGLGAFICVELRKQRHRCICVEIGEQFACLNQDHYSFNPASHEDYQRLISILRREDRQVDRILHLWTYTSDTEKIDSIDELLTAQETGTFSILLLAQALSREIERELSWMVIGSNTQEISTHDPIAYEKTPLLGLLKTLGQETPAWHCQHISLPVDDIAVNSSFILKEISSFSTDQEVAYQNRSRFIPRLSKVDYRQIGKRDDPFKTGGMYLLTGGLGGIGIQVARYLREQYHANLLLVGRTALPADDAKQTSDGQTSKLSAAYQAVEQIEGGALRYVAVDVSDLEQLRKVIDETERLWRCELDGVIHLAGHAHECLLQEETCAGLAATLRPKAVGAWVLAQLIKERPACLFLSFSSVNSFFGGAGLGAYAAANRFLNAFTLHPSLAGSGRSYCFAWSMWKGVGMNERYTMDQLSISRGFIAIDVRQGLQSLLVGASHQPGCIFIGLDDSNANISFRTQQKAIEKYSLSGYFTTQSSSFNEALLHDLHVSDRFGTPSHCDFHKIDEMPLTATGQIDRMALSARQEEISVEHTVPKNDIERVLISIWKEVLAVDRVDTTMNLFEQGGNSIQAVRIRGKLQQILQKDVSVVDIFRYPTISELARFIEQGPELLTRNAPGATVRAESAVGKQDIAVIGMAGRFPGAQNIEEYWQNLQSGRETISFFTDEELLADGIDQATMHHPKYVKAKGILDDIDLFDANFFGFSPREARLMDPQHRIFLECAWEALEHAGYSTGAAQRIGVFAGASMNTYMLSVNAHANLSTQPLPILIGGDKDFLATRVSYKLNLRGPGVTLQTACSTSLVCVHFAAQSLLNQECDMALAGGVSVRVPHRDGYFYQEGGIASPDGHCRAFDAHARGSVVGEGVGIVVLKRLEQAIADGDTVYAVIKGSAINNDGALKVGYTAPGVEGQAEVIERALVAANVPAETITYVETHGTGTILGDPIEIAALTQAFHCERTGFCAIGSVKTNIGHLDAAAGVASLIKVILALRHKQLPPSLHFTVPNPQIDFANSPFYVNTKLTSWDVQNIPRRAGVSSFGVGGTNVHVILEEAPSVESLPSDVERPIHILTLSAKNKEALQEHVTRFAAYITHSPDASVEDICYSANSGRTHFAERLAVQCQSLSQLQERLQAIAVGERLGEVFTGTASTASSQQVAFLFTGQGSQYPHMGYELFRTQPTFRRVLEHCDELLRPYLETPLLAALYPETGTPSLLDKTLYVQPALFAVEYALAELWRSWGVKPAIVMGHSLGEYVAACVANIISLEDGLKLVMQRAQLMQQSEHKGAMALAFASADKVATLLAPYAATVSIAAINGPKEVTIAGVRDDLQRVVEVLQAQDIKTRSLGMPFAFHSPVIEPVLEPLREIASTIAYASPTIPLVSNVTGKLVEGDEASHAQYWCKHARSTVQFFAGMKTLYDSGYRNFLEIGPAPLLLAMARPQFTDQQCLWLPSLRQRRGDWQQMLDSLGRLYTRGMLIDWHGFDKDYIRRHVAIPTYPFQRQRYWLATREGEAHAAPLQGQRLGEMKLLGRRIHTPLPQIIFEIQLGERGAVLTSASYDTGSLILSEVLGRDIVATVLKEAFERDTYVIEQIQVEELLLIPSGEVRILQIILSPHDKGEVSFQLFSVDEHDTWHLYITGQARNTYHTSFPQDDHSLLSDHYFYTTSYQQKKRAQPNDSKEHTQREQSWLILSDDGGIGKACFDILRARGEHVHLVYVGEEYMAEAEDTYYVNPSRAADFQRLFEAVRLDNKHVQHQILYCWGMDDPPIATTAIHARIAQQRVYGGLLHLVQTLLSDWGDAQQRLWIVTCNVQPVEESEDSGARQEQLSLGQAPLWGIGRSVALEHPDMWGGLIDIARSATTDDLQTLLTEIQFPDSEDQVILRQGKRYVIRLLRDERQEQETEALTFQVNGTYLITGGLGNLGLQAAQWIVQQGARHLVLLGRTGLPPRSSWPTITAQDQRKKCIEVIKLLEEQGAIIHVVQADVGNREQMLVCIEEVQRSLPPLYGIIHAAGVASPCALKDMTFELLAETLHAKVTGTWVLHELTRKLKLDFFVCYSSIASVWGSVDLGHHAAASYFLDMFAHQRRMLGLPAISINWGPIAGNSIATGETRQWLTRLGVSILSGETAVAALEDIVSRRQYSHPQITVANIAWDIFKPIYEARKPSTLLEHVVATTDASVTRRTRQASPLHDRLTRSLPAQRKDLLRMLVRELVNALLELDDPTSLDENKPLSEYGLDSLMSVELRNALSEEVACTLPATLLFEYPSVEALVEYLSTLVEKPLEEPAEQSSRSRAPVSSDTGTEEAVQLSVPELEARLIDELEKQGY